MYHGIELFENMLAYEHKSDIDPVMRGIMCSVRDVAFRGVNPRTRLFKNMFRNSRDYYDIFRHFSFVVSNRDTHTVSDLVEYLKSGDTDNRYSFSVYTDPDPDQKDCILSIRIDKVSNPDNQCNYVIYNFIVNKNDASKINPSFLSHDVCEISKDPKFLNIYTDNDLVKFVISCYTRSGKIISRNDIENLNSFIENKTDDETGGDWS